MAGSDRELQQIDVLAELPKLTDAITQLNGNLARFMAGIEARTNRMEEYAERNDGVLQSVSDGHAAIEAQLRRLNENVSRIAQVAIRTSASSEYPWPAEPSQPRRRRRAKAERQGQLLVVEENERPSQDELAAAFLATLQLADRPSRG